MIHSPYTLICWTATSRSSGVRNQSVVGEEPNLSLAKIEISYGQNVLYQKTKAIVSVNETIKIINLVRSQCHRTLKVYY